MFSFFKRKPVVPVAPPEPDPAPAAERPAPTPATDAGTLIPVEPVVPSVPSADEPRRGWFDKLRSGLRKTGTSIAQVFTGTQIDERVRRPVGGPAHRPSYSH